MICLFEANKSFFLTRCQRCENRSRSHLFLFNFIANASVSVFLSNALNRFQVQTFDEKIFDNMSPEFLFFCGAIYVAFVAYNAALDYLSNQI